jgi:hypothetical protein
LAPVERLRAVEARYANRVAEFERGLEALVLGEPAQVPEISLLDRDDPQVRAAVAQRLRETAERRARAGKESQRRFVETVRSWLPSEAPTPERPVEAATLGDLVVALSELPGFGAVLESWARRQGVGGAFAKLNDAAFVPTNASKREVARALGRDRLLRVLPERSSLRAELLRLLQ